MGEKSLRGWTIPSPISFDSVSSALGSPYLGPELVRGVEEAIASVSRTSSSSQDVETRWVQLSEKLKSVVCDSWRNLANWPHRRLHLEVVC